MSTKIITCKCNSEYQDKTYGEQKRIHNKMKDSNKYRCTVCGNECVSLVGGS